MPVSDIYAKYVNYPEQGKKMGNVNTGDEKYFAFPEILNEIKQGQTHTVLWEEFGDRGAKKIVSLRSMLPDEPERPGVVERMDREDYKKPMQRTQSDNKSMEMFVMGICGRTLQGTGEVPPKEVLADFVAACKYAWEKNFS